MKALILGGNGFIGSHLVDKLLAMGHQVRVFDKYGELFREPLENVEYFYGDFGNRGLVVEALNGIDIVFHLISTTLPKTSNDDPMFDVQSNVIETLFLIESCLKNKIKKIVYISSGGTVYGTPTSLPIHEDSYTNPICSYGIAKLTIEKYLYLYRHLEGLNYVIIRPSNAYGERQNPNGIQGAVSVFIANMVKNNPIEIWGDGQVIRDYIYVTDLVAGIYRAAITETEETIFNMGSGIGKSLTDILGIITKISGKTANVNKKARRKFDIPCMVLDNDLAEQKLNWKPIVSIEEGIKNTFDFINKTIGS